MAWYVLQSPHDDKRTYMLIILVILRTSLDDEQSSTLTIVPEWNTKTLVILLGLASATRSAVIPLVYVADNGLRNTKQQTSPIIVRSEPISRLVRCVIWGYSLKQAC